MFSFYHFFICSKLLSSFKYRLRFSIIISSLLSIKCSPSIIFLIVYTSDLLFLLNIFLYFLILFFLFFPFYFLLKYFIKFFICNLIHNFRIFHIISTRVVIFSSCFSTLCSLLSRCCFLVHSCCETLRNFR